MPNALGNDHFVIHVNIKLDVHRNIHTMLTAGNTDHSLRTYTFAALIGSDLGGVEVNAFLQVLDALQVQGEALLAFGDNDVVESVVAVSIGSQNELAFLCLTCDTADGDGLTVGTHNSNDQIVTVFGAGGNHQREGNVSHISVVGMVGILIILVGFGFLDNGDGHILQEVILVDDAVCGGVFDVGGIQSHQIVIQTEHQLDFIFLVLADIANTPVGVVGVDEVDAGHLVAAGPDSHLGRSQCDTVSQGCDFGFGEFTGGQKHLLHSVQAAQLWNLVSVFVEFGTDSAPITVADDGADHLCFFIGIVSSVFQILNVVTVDILGGGGKVGAVSGDNVAVFVHQNKLLRTSPNSGVLILAVQFADPFAVFVPAFDLQTVSGTVKTVQVHSVAVGILGGELFLQNSVAVDIQKETFFVGHIVAVRVRCNVVAVFLGQAAYIVPSDRILLDVRIGTKLCKLLFVGQRRVKHDCGNELTGVAGTCVHILVAINALGNDCLAGVTGQISIVSNIRGMYQIVGAVGIGFASDILHLSVLGIDSFGCILDSFKQRFRNDLVLL